MAKTLSIYACSGIGANPQAEKQQYDYWLDNTNSVTNTQAVNTLLAHINTDAIEVLNLDLTDQEVLERLNDIDFYSTVLYFVRQYQDKADMLIQAKLAIGKAWDGGLFDYVEFDNKKRDLHLDEVIQKVSEYMDDADLQDPSAVFGEWWSKEIDTLNQNGFTQDQQQKLMQTLQGQKVSGIGANYDVNKDLANYLNNAGEYFLYTFASDQQLAQLPAMFKRKRDIQRSIYNYCKGMYVGVFGTEAAMQEVIYAGIIRQIGSTPQKAIENVVTAYKNRGAQPTSGVGSLTISAAALAAIKAVTALISAIMALLSIVAGIVVSICECVKSIEVAKWQSVDRQVIDESIPSDEEFSDFSLSRSNNKSLLIGGAILLFALLFNRK